MKRVDLKHRAWIRSLPCCVPGCRQPSVPHHVRTAANSGTGLKPADIGNTVPMCHAHHAEGHDRGWKAFEAKYNLDLSVEAAWCATASGSEMP